MPGKVNRSRGHSDEQSPRRARRTWTIRGGSPNEKKGKKNTHKTVNAVRKSPVRPELCGGP